LDNPEVNEVDVNGMGPASGVVLKLPDLNFASWNFRKHTVGGIGKTNIINLPLATRTVETECMINTGVASGREWNGS